MIERFKNPQDINRFMGSARAQFTPFTGLNVNYTFGYDGYSLEQSEFFPRGAFPPGTAATGSRRQRRSRLADHQPGCGRHAQLVRAGQTSQSGTTAGVNYTSAEIRTTTADRDRI